MNFEEQIKLLQIEKMLAQHQNDYSSYFKAIEHDAFTKELLSESLNRQIEIFELGDGLDLSKTRFEKLEDEEIEKNGVIIYDLYMTYKEKEYVNRITAFIQTETTIIPSFVEVV